jgi:hypothetical protein
MNGAVLVATLRMLPRVSKPLTIALLALAIGETALGLAFMLAVGRFVGSVPAWVTGQDTGWLDDLADVGLIYVAQQVLAALVSLTGWWFGQRLNHYLSDRGMALMLAPPGIGHLENSRTRDLAAEVADGLGAGVWRPTLLPATLRSLVAAALGLIVAFGLVARSAWWLALLVAAASIWALHAVVRRSLTQILEMIETTGEAEFRRMAYERETAVGPATAKEVRLFGFGPWLLDRWQERLRHVLALDLRKIARLDTRSWPLCSA